MKNGILRKISMTGILSAFATIAFIIEGLFPPLFIPGARMGISNIFILLTVVILGYKYGFAVLIVKIVIGSLFSGNVSAMLYSLPAGIISCTVQVLMVNLTEKFSITAISVTGAIVNVTVQNTVFCLITRVWQYLAYLPYLALTGLISGLIVGLSVYLIIKKLPLKILAENK
ncbi:MAG: Gx transporter family protein [Clostridia bacterium]|nr:Gx transporter family protein [Clostridia bacterium]